MRKPLRKIVEPLRKKLKKNEETKPFADTMINVELLAVGSYSIDKNLRLADAWSLLTGYDEPVIPSGKSKQIISRLRILFSQFTGQAIWEREMDTYFQIPEKYRLVELEDDGRIIFLTPRFDPSRKDEYINVLKSPIPKESINLEFAEPGEFFYRRKIENMEYPFHGNIPTSWVNDNKSLPDYRKKKSIHFQLEFDWLTIAEEMDRVLGKDLWKIKAKSMQLKSRTGNTVFNYKGIQHIGGGLASGKSTFRTINTYWLVTRKNAKVGILEGNVAQVLEWVQELRELGILAVPIIGRSGREKHMENYIFSNPFESITDIATYDSMSHLSDICLIHALAKDLNEDRVKYFPCKSLFRNKYDRTPKMCPLSHICGVYKDWIELVDADVWVTTPSAVLHSRLPGNIDPLERLLYEAMYDLLDVIFIDEADIVQKGFDEAFLEEHSAFGHPEFLVEKLRGQLNVTIQGNYELADNHLLTQWRKNLEHLYESVWSLYEETKKSPAIRNYLEKSVVYLNYFIYEISQKFAKDDKQQRFIAEAMRNFVRESTYSSVGNSDERLHGLINVSSQTDKRKLVEDWIKQLGCKIPEGQSFSNTYNQIKFFVYLAHIEQAMKWILEYYPVVQQYLHPSVEIPLLTQIRDFHPFMKEAMTGVMLGYRYETKDGSDTGAFKIIQYLAVGRQLMNEWSLIYEAADNKKGPAIILLSGTSYAPRSLHYHIETEPGWYMEPTRKLSKITQMCLEIRDPDKGEKLVSVSGVQNPITRQKNLQTLVLEISQKIEDELRYWRELGENRKVLLIVNSYDDVEIVGEALQRLPQWEGRYRLLSRKEQNDEIYYPRSKIEQFAGHGDILVVPMLAISRGYNIMDKTGKGALFGTSFFLVRPYPVPNDLGYLVQILHGNLPVYLKEIKEKQLTYAEAMRELRKQSRRDFENMYKTPDYWSLLNEEKKVVLSWFTFIPTWQLIGRLLRGGKDARVYYCDAKFFQAANTDKALLDYWAKIMIDNENDPLFYSLYGPFVESIKDCKRIGVY